MIQQRVRHWHEKIFSGRKPLATAKKILEEASELHIAAKNLGDGSSWPDVMEECADVAIACYALAVIGGFDLEFAMLRKLEILSDPARGQKERDKERGIE